MNLPLNRPESFQRFTQTFANARSDWLAIPFDMACEHYVLAVRSGLIERSMLASARFSRTLTALERLTLGPWARGN
jgi:hypothetical protein